MYHTPIALYPPKRTHRTLFWKRLKGKNPEGKNFRKLPRRKQSSAKISKISRNTIKSRKSDLFYLLRNLLKYLLRTFFLPRSFQKFLPFAFLPSGSFRLLPCNKGGVSHVKLSSKRNRAIPPVSQLYHLPPKHYPINSENFKSGNGNTR